MHLKGYQWPADKLTSEEMAILYNQREKHKIPINELLRQAVHQINPLTTKG